MDNFFNNYSPDQWTFDNFNTQYKIHHPDAKLSRVLQVYFACLQRISRESDDRNIKERIGRLLKQTKDFETKADHSININNHGNGIAVGVNYGSIIQEGTAVEKGVNKRIKTNHIEEASAWKVDDEEDLWDAWRQYIESCTCHEFCPEKYHVIECGYSIRCNSQMKEMLQDHLEVNSHKIKSPFQSCSEFTFAACDILRNMTELNWREARRQLAKIEVDSKPESAFAEDWFFFCHELFKRDSLYDFLSAGNEAVFDYAVVWPLMDVATNSIKPKVKLMLGEYTLKASNEEYKADACLIDMYDNEICLLETSSNFLHKESGKLGYDHVKGTFGTLTLFNALYKKYHRASQDTAMGLTIPFVHARDDSVHLWSLELCSKKIYALKKVYKAKVPTNQQDVANILALGNLAWCLRGCIEATCRTINKMKQEHDSFEVRRLMGQKVESSLYDMVNTDLKKPIKGTGYGILLPEEASDNEISIQYIP
ncbi:hypothetical protein BD560DRAFT_489820 [Blakeslea trispora]|nr:hypothetical protein BD560DRAFT_489820 [Blakeslea trispora]